MSADKDLKILKDLDETLDKTITFVNNSFSTIGDFENQAQSVIQDEVDKICVKVNEKVNTKLNEVRNKTVETLKNKYISANQIIQKLQPIVNAKLSDLGSVISILNKIIALYAQPYQQALQYTTEFIAIATPLLVNITNKLNTLSNIKDNVSIPDNMDVNLDKLSISVDPININDIVSG